MKHRIIAHKNAFLVVVILILMASALTPRSFHLVGDVTLAAQRSGEYKDGEVIVQLKPGVVARQLAARYNLTVKKDHKNNQYLLSLTNLTARDRLSVGQLVARLSKDRDVEWVEPNYLVGLDQFESDQRSIPNIDPRSMPFLDGVSPADYFQQYALTLVKAPQAHAITKGFGVTVAVIDSGVDTTHPLFRNVTVGYDFVDNDTDPSETGLGNAYGHGTHAAGVVLLVAPDATIMPIRAFNSAGMGDASAIASAIRWAADQGAQVINMSFSYHDELRVVKDAVVYARSRGAVLVASAGNTGGAVRYPARAKEVIAVAATDAQDRKTSWTCEGKEVHVAAPGVSIYSAYPGGGWAWWDGTSFAAPLVSGEAALIIARGRHSDVAKRIGDTADPVGGGLGKGRINCYEAVR